MKILIRFAVSHKKDVKASINEYEQAFQNIKFVIIFLINT